MLMLKSPSLVWLTLFTPEYVCIICMYVSFGVTTSVLLVFITAITCDGIVIRTG